ncbi:MAG TPA: MlaD family protein [Blastocatellia bacterium]|nr:MlaD family protein [Blastocatellia bacterium]
MSRTVWLGMFIFAALLIFGVAVFMVGDRQFVFSRTYPLKSTFDNVAGLETGAAVRSGGVRVGTVDDIRLPQRSGEKVVVEMKLEESTRHIIKKDSVASIETEGLLGNKYVAISFGSQNAEPVRDWDMLAGQPPMDFSDLAKRMNDVAEKTSEVLDSARGVMDKASGAVDNVDAMTANLKSVSAKINRGEGTIGALINDRQVYQSLNAATQDIRQTMAAARTGVVSFQENMEALKHNWFFRGFFRDRGYFDASELEEHIIAELPKTTPVKQFVIDGRRLFDKPDTAKFEKKELLDPVGKYLEQNPFSLVVIAAWTGEKGKEEDNLKLTQARAAVVLDYLASKFRIDDTRLKTKGMGEDRAGDPAKADRIEIYVYADDQRTAAQKQ